jgi:hypothetical protein
VRSFADISLATQLLFAATWLLFVLVLSASAIWAPLRDRRKVKFLPWGVRQRHWRPLRRATFQATTVIAFHAAAVALNALAGGWMWREWSWIVAVVCAVAAVLQTVVSGHLYRIICFGSAFRTPGGDVWFSESPIGFSVLALLIVWGNVLSISFVAFVGGYMMFAGLQK